MINVDMDIDRELHVDMMISVDLDIGMGLFVDMNDKCCFGY